MIDHKQGEILKKIKESHKVPSEISFQKNGDILLKIDDNGKDDEEPRLAARTEKTKVICKEQKSVGNVVKTEHNRNEEDKSDKLAGKSATTTGEAVSVVSAGASATVTDQGLTSKHTS